MRICRKAAAKVTRRDKRTGCGEKRPHVSKYVHLKSQKLTVIVEGQLTYSNGVSTLVVTNERFASRRHPTHSRLERLGGRQQANVLRINRRFHSERATNVFGKYDDGFRGHPQCQSQLLPQSARSLRSASKSINLCGRIESGESAALRCMTQRQAADSLPKYSLREAR